MSSFTGGPWISWQFPYAILHAYMLFNRGLATNRKAMKSDASIWQEPETFTFDEAMI